MYARYYEEQGFPSPAGVRHRRHPRGAALGKQLSFSCRCRLRGACCAGLGQATGSVVGGDRLVLAAELINTAMENLASQPDHTVSLRTEIAALEAGAVPS